MQKYLLILILSVVSFGLYADRPPIYPPSLKKGDTIAIIAPASCPEENQHGAVSRAVSLLKQRGYKVRIAPNLFTRFGYLAGTDYDRAKALMDAWKDPEVKAIWCYRGGYGCARILERIDYQVIRENPKLFIGMSDITALHAAINKETGLVTFLGPTVNGVYGSSKNNDSMYSERELFKVITPEPSDHLFRADTKSVIISGGWGRGRLTGGTLSLVASLVGTPWEIDTRGKILVLEEVDEEPYRIDRMLRQLKQAGLLEKPAGVVLCSWRACQGKRRDRTLSLDHVFKDYFSNATYPVLMGFPSGHIKDQNTLPLNSLAELDATKKIIRLLEEPVR